MHILCILIGYFIGCIQSAFFVGKFMHVDIRQHGSGNLGSTNALRVLGKRAGIITFACDILKSVAAYWLCRFLFQDLGRIAGLYGCFGVVLGHDFPFYLKFKGGKGIASMIGMMFCIGYSPFPVILVTFGIGISGLFTKYVSIGSIVFSVSIPISMALTGFSWEYTVLTGILAVLAVYRHKANIQRLLNGTENRLGQKKTAL